MRICNLCGVEKSVTEFYKQSKNSMHYRGRCKSCDRLTKTNDPEYKRAWKLRTKYGINPEQFDEMLEAQNGVCAICKKECPSGTRLSVDHDHETGQVRALLCKNCNLVIGYAHENVEILLDAVDYLNSFKGKGVSS